MKRAGGEGAQRGEDTKTFQTPFIPVALYRMKYMYQYPGKG